MGRGEDSPEKKITVGSVIAGHRRPVKAPVAKDETGTAYEAIERARKEQERVARRIDSLWQEALDEVAADLFRHDPSLAAIRTRDLDAGDVFEDVAVRRPNDLVFSRNPPAPTPDEGQDSDGGGGEGGEGAAGVEKVWRSHFIDGGHYPDILHPDDPESARQCAERIERLATVLSCKTPAQLMAIAEDAFFRIANDYDDE